MRDVLNIFGAHALAVTATPVYSADSLHFGAIDSRARSSLHQTGRQELSVVFELDAALASIDQYTPFIQDSADGTTWATILTGPISPANAAGRAAGARIELPMPKQHREHVRTGCLPYSSGTFTAVSVTSWLEAGPNN